MILKAITDKSWFLLNGDDRIGILSESNGAYRLIGKSINTTFSSKTEIISVFKEDIFDSVVSGNAESAIDGYPTNVSSPFKVDGHKLPVYTKSDQSKIEFCAGYYCILFEKGWVPSFCPKLDTLNNNRFRGPFANESDARLEISIQKKSFKTDKYKQKDI